MVFTRHVSRQLAQYCDGQLTAAEARAVERHLVSCARCCAERDEIQFTAGVLRQLTSVTAPASVWNGIAARLGQPAAGVWRPVPALVYLLALVVTGAAAYWFARPSVDEPWTVSRLDRAGTTRMAEGEWLETEPAGRARIAIGAIGTVDVEPQTRVRLGPAGPTEYRLSLARGTINARIAAPPRLFFVETPASTVVDLGCAYTVNVDDSGRGSLQVTEGWASLEWNARESLVPAGAQCAIRPAVGPGTPYFTDASANLRQALDDLDFGDGGAAALSVVLAESRVRDTLTLWHLLSRVAPSQRPRVYERIAELTPVPPGVSREKALQLDAATLKHWREELAWRW
jgi:anti-sigma factor RsiW